MSGIILFETKTGVVTTEDLYAALIKIGANQCDYLFIHSEINFGTPNIALSKKELLGHILAVIKSLGVKNILVPTFTFSFCNKEDFDVQKTKSAMGVFSEYFRKLPEAKRSADPLMSVAMIGEDYSIIEDIDNISCGANSTYDLLHKKGRTKFLFLGNKMSECMTYTHYMEVVKNVPYRYARPFKGNVTNNGVTAEKTYYLHVRYNEILPFNDNRIDDLILSNHEGQTLALGDSVINIANEPGVYKYLGAAIEKNPDFMLCHKCPAPPFDDFYVYEKKVAL